jgi:hypothetical protein
MDPESLRKKVDYNYETYGWTDEQKEVLILFTVMNSL